MDPLLHKLDETHQSKVVQFRKLALEDVSSACNSFQKYCNEYASEFLLLFEFAKFLRDLDQSANALKVSEHIQKIIESESLSLHRFNADLRRITGDLPSAIESYICILRIKSDDLGAGLNLSVCLAHFGDISQAIQVLKASLKFHPNNADLLINLGNLYYLNKDFTNSKGSHLRALNEGANEVFVLVNLCQTLRKLCDWEQLGKYELRLASITENELTSNRVPVEPPLHCMVRSDDRELLRRLTKAHATKLLSPIPFGRQVPGSRIRLGFVSDDFREHPVAHLILPIVRNLDRSKFEIHLFCYGKGDGSNVRKNLFESVENIHHLSGDYLSFRRQIQSCLIDILFDLKGWTINHLQNLFSLRAAPIQITFLGFSGGTFNPSMDYVIGDETVTVNQSDFSESIICMDNGFMPFGSYQEETPKVFERELFDLPNDHVIAAVCVSSDKVTEELFLSWIRCFKLVNKSSLWILSSTAEVQQNYIKFWIREGLCKDRLIFTRKPHNRNSGFLSKAEHLARISKADLVLDSWNYNGHSSTVDAIMAKVPVLCCYGLNWSARSSASILKSVGLENFICKDRSHYEEQLLRLLTDKKILGNWKLGFDSIDLESHFNNWIQEFQYKLTDIAKNKVKQT